MADDEELDRHFIVAQAAISLHQDVQVFLAGNASDVEQAHMSVVFPELIPELRVPPAGMKKLGIESTRKNLEPGRIKTAFDPALAILLRIHKNRIELPVEPVHVAPRNAFEEAVFREDADVLRKIGVVDAARAQVQ